MSRKYKIIFIDEEPAVHRMFQGYVDYYEKDAMEQVTLEVSVPLPNLSDTINLIRENQYDAVITDQQFNGIGYDGASLYTELKKKSPLIPCFIFTSYEDDAMDAVGDVNAVYLKDFEIPDVADTSSGSDSEIVMNKTPGGKPVHYRRGNFIRRVCRQIDTVRKDVEEREKTYIRLRKKIEDGEASMEEEADYAEAERFLQGAYREALPDMPRLELPTARMLKEILEKADRILSK